MTDVREATHVKVGGVWEKIVEKWGIGPNGELAPPSKGGFGVVTETGKRVGMYQAEAYTVVAETDLVAGFLEVGTTGGGEVVINHPRIEVDNLGVGHIIFSPQQARSFARTLNAKANEAEKEAYDAR